MSCWEHVIIISKHGNVSIAVVCTVEAMNDRVHNQQRLMTEVTGVATYSSITEIKNFNLISVDE